jgi:hypothetical protein
MTDNDDDSGIFVRQGDSDPTFEHRSIEFLWLEYDNIDLALQPHASEADRQIARRILPLITGAMGMFERVGAGGRLHDDTKRHFDAFTAGAYANPWGDQMRRVHTALETIGFFVYRDGHMWLGGEGEFWIFADKDLDPNEVGA